MILEPPGCSGQNAVLDSSSSAFRGGGWVRRTWQELGHIICFSLQRPVLDFCNAQICIDAAEGGLGRHTWTMTQHESALLCCATSPPFSVIVVGAIVYRGLASRKSGYRGVNAKGFVSRARKRRESQGPETKKATGKVGWAGEGGNLGVKRKKSRVVRNRMRPPTRTDLGNRRWAEAGAAGWCGVKRRQHYYRQAN